MTDHSPASPTLPDVLRTPGVPRYFASRVLVTFATQIVSVSIGWLIYDLTRNPLNLGLVGLVQFLPFPLLVFVTGVAADRYSRRRIMALCAAGGALCVTGLLSLTYTGVTAVWPIYALLTLFSVTRAFLAPAATSLLANLVTGPKFAPALAINSTAFQAALILGPMAGGLLYGVSAQAALGTAIVLLVTATLLMLTIPAPAQHSRREPTTPAVLLAGARYVWTNKMVLGASTLDLFAVLLGGATALLPVYARDILDAGPLGLGLLRAGPGVGAILMGLLLASRPLRSHAGLWMFGGVAMFGLATTLFGLSTQPWLSVAAMVVLGASDMISINVRATLVQLATPDELRGRVTAVNQVFISTSNELGEFRAGTMASLIGAVPAVVLGGIATLGVAGLWAALFPDLRRAQRLDGR